MNSEPICYNSSCPSKLSCAIYTRPPGEWQNWAHFTPSEETGQCAHYREEGGRTLLDIFAEELDGEENILGVSEK
jgi:hypothetical protein